MSHVSAKHNNSSRVQLEAARLITDQLLSTSVAVVLTEAGHPTPKSRLRYLALRKQMIETTFSHLMTATSCYTRCPQLPEVQGLVFTSPPIITHLNIQTPTLCRTVVSQMVASNTTTTPSSAIRRPPPTPKAAPSTRRAVPYVKSSNGCDPITGLWTRLSVIACCSLQALSNPGNRDATFRDI